MARRTSSSSATGATAWRKFSSTLRAAGRAVTRPNPRRRKAFDERCRRCGPVSADGYRRIGAARPRVDPASRVSVAEVMATPRLDGVLPDRDDDPVGFRHDLPAADEPLPAGCAGIL